MENDRKKIKEKKMEKTRKTGKNCGKFGKESGKVWRKIKARKFQKRGIFLNTKNKLENAEEFKKKMMKQPKTVEEKNEQKSNKNGENF